MRRQTVAALVVAVTALALFAAFQAGVWPSRGGEGTGSTTACGTCFQAEPVVDIVMPALGTSGNFSNPNRIVNVSVGESRTFEVDLYPTAALTFDMSFGSYQISAGTEGSTSGSGADITASFQPSTLNIGANQKGVTYMTITVPTGVAKGTYDGVASATNHSNSSEVWGLYFEIFTN